ncbi:MAG: hypothetical protein EBT15_06925 [Betaproteobacteria bacterium]|nr:hypothetical protein [Betaproteobacteria bacterium]
MDYGNRPDGTKKSSGFFGPIKRPDGKVMTEISIGVGLNGKEVTIPLIVPTLDKNEIEYLLRNDPNSPSFMEDMPPSIVNKAVDHAVLRMNEGKSPFIEDGESAAALPE